MIASHLVTFLNTNICIWLTKQQLISSNIPWLMLSVKYSRLLAQLYFSISFKTHVLDGLYIIQFIFMYFLISWLGHFHYNGIWTLVYQIFHGRSFSWELHSQLLILFFLSTFCHTLQSTCLTESKEVYLHF